MLTAYERVNNTANQKFDGRLEAGVETMPQITIDQAGYIIQRHYNQPYAPFTFRSPHFYIPSLRASLKGPRMVPRCCVWPGCLVCNQTVRVRAAR